MAKVLIVDDDSMMCDLLAKMVGRLEHEVVCSHNLKDGLDQVRSADYDIVFLDIFLPDGNGLDVLPEIRSTRSLPEVIIITGAGIRTGRP